MNYFCVDASAMAKRYVPEVGSDLLDLLFDTIDHNRLLWWDVGIAEVMSIFVRQRNNGRITQDRFNQARIQFRAEVIRSNTLRILHTTLPLILNALPLIPTHSINGNDAIFLQAAIEVAAELRTNPNGLVIVASDTRLIRAAQSEGLLTFNPETETAAGLQRLI
ncbi:type II toxin-antitoxin system VapC family toxin [Candidatus Poribacteria bacterium]|nr:type II toxin-antitoxin system VapC family toxin [Candidatus Poribacteria bacterium]